ncbi:MAG: hypothetical protein J6K29_07900 [Clostridia bacterium]|nr:hypothetical protein [Clostridia bacterium]
MKPSNQTNQNPPPRRTRRSRTTRRIAMCAVLCALSVVMLGLGALIEVIDITAAAVASLALLPILLCYGARYAWLSYAVTGVLGVLLMPQSLGAWMFAGLTGFYPIVKQRLDRLPRVLSWLVKLLLLTAVLLLYLAVFYFVMLGGEGSLLDAFLGGFGESDGKPIIAWVTIGLSVFTYVLFDLLIDRLLILYYIKWQKRVERWMKP